MKPGRLYLKVTTLCVMTWSIVAFFCNCPVRAVESVNRGATPPPFLYVQGMVKNPGRYAYSDGATLSGVLKKAGGVTRQASALVSVKRGGKQVLSVNRKKLKDKSRDLRLQPGDVVVVLKK